MELPAGLTSLSILSLGMARWLLQPIARCCTQLEDLQLGCWGPGFQPERYQTATSSA